MTIVWKISKEDVSRVNAIVARQKNNPIVLARVKRNLAGTRARVSKERLWQALVSCLLTTQQRSGPGSAVTRFNRARPFALAYSACVGERHLRAFVARTISAFGGIRRAPTLAIQIADNFKLLEGGLWPEVHREIERLTECKMVTRATEVEVANFINERLAGFGPKQARNLLQGLGLTRYEIPIDSRISKWLKEFGFPAPLSPAALSDRHYYHFISTAVVELCERSGVFPCVLDAAVFTSFDESLDPAQR